MADKEIARLKADLATNQQVIQGALNLLNLFDNQPETDNTQLRSEVEAERDAAEKEIASITAQIQQWEQDESELASTSISPLQTLRGLISALSSLPTSDAKLKSIDYIIDSFLAGHHFSPDQKRRFNNSEKEDRLEQEQLERNCEQHEAEEPRLKYLLDFGEVVGPVMECLGEQDGSSVVALKEKAEGKGKGKERESRTFGRPTGTQLRAAAYRLLRYLVVDMRDVREARARGLEWFLIRSLSLPPTPTHDQEKSQSLRLIRLLLSLPLPDAEAAGEGGVEREERERPVNECVLRAVVALAESNAAEESLKLAALETLAELLIRDVDLLVRVEGLRVVLQTLADGPHDFSPFLAMAFLSVFDRPGTRGWLRGGIDIEIVLASFTEAPAKGASAQQEERIRASAKIVTLFLQSWSGLMYLCSNGRQALVALVESLKTPSKLVRDILLDMMVKLFNIKAPAWYASFLAGKGMTLYSNLEPSIESYQFSQTTNGGGSLTDQYLAVLLLVFIDAGLLEVLVTVAIEPKDASSARKVSLLLSELMELSARVLPASYAARVQALPGLFNQVSKFNTSDARMAASSTLSVVDSLHRNRERLIDSPSEAIRPRSNSIDDPLKRGQRRVENAKIRMGMLIDDAGFRNLLLETQVLSTKDHTRWNFDTLLELLEGPLLAPKRLDEAMRASKFMRRLVTFFQPLSYQYSYVRKSPQTIKYTKSGCTLISTLMANPDGLRYISEDKLLRQIVDCLVQLDPASGQLPSGSEAFLSKRRVDATLCSGYFQMLGTLTKSSDGIKLLEQLKAFSALYKIVELRGRLDLVRLILESIDYSRDGHPRVLLSKCLTSADKNVRIFATQHLATLCRDNVVVPEWQIRLLLTQIYDPENAVCELAVKVLEEACESLETLELVVQMRPSLDHLGDVGTMLLTRFLSTSIGVRYLHEIQFIERELDDWFNERNATYVVQLELSLASILGPGPIQPPAAHRTFNGDPPPHFYGELIKTDEGCQILEDSGHFPEFADFIRQHGLEDFDSEIITKLKSVLWAVGHVGASPNGVPFLEDEFIVQSIVEIAEDSPVYSLRGTAFFVLGLISSTLEGAEILYDLGWETGCTPLGNPTGICLPRVVSTFTSTSPWLPLSSDVPKEAALSPPTDHLEREVLAALANLSNHILATKASKALARLKLRHRELFTSHTMYYRALDMLANHHYRLPVRRFILELFDISLNSATVASLSAVGAQLRSKAHNGAARNRGSPLPGLATKAATAFLGALDGELSEEDDESESGDLEENGTVIPLQILPPLLSVRGFLIS